MNKHKVLAIFCGCLAIGAINETINIYRTAAYADNWQPKAVAAVAAGIAITFTVYFWRKSTR